MSLARDAVVKLVQSGDRNASRQSTPEESDFDAVYGTDTGGIIQPWDLDIPDRFVAQAVQYGSASVEAFNELLSSLDIDHKNYVFIDLGCGKGRALLLASRFPFKRILGVELSAELQQISLANIQRFQSSWQRCTDIVSLCENAATFSFPDENVVLYLFNPFGARTLRLVMANLERSLRVWPTRVYIVYVKPVHKNVVEDSRLFTLCHTIGDNAIFVSDGSRE